MEAKRRQERSNAEEKSLPNRKELLDLKGAGKLLNKARSLRVDLAKEIDDSRPPSRIKDNLARLKVERSQASKAALLQKKRKSPEKVENRSFRAPQIPGIPRRNVVSKAKLNKSRSASSDHDIGDEEIVLLGRPVIRDISETERKQMEAAQAKNGQKSKPNISLATYKHIDSPRSSERVKPLTAHFLNGVSISPASSPFEPSNVSKPTVVSGKNVAVLKATFHDSSLDDDSLKVIETADAKYEPPSEITDPKTREDSEAKEIKSNISEQEADHREEEEVPADDYSDSFEEDEEEAEELLKQFIPKVMAMDEYEEDTITDRLSTIHEVPSQITNTDEEDSNKILSLDEGPLSPESKEMETKEDQDVVNLSKLSLSEGPLVPSDDNSLSSDLVKPVQEKPLDLSEGPLSDSKDEDEAKSKKVRKIDDVPEEAPMPPPLVKSSEESAEKIAQPSSDLDWSVTEASEKKTQQQSSSSSSSAFATSSSSTSANISATSSSFKAESVLSEGQVVTKNLLSEGELTLQSSHPGDHNVDCSGDVSSEKQ